MITKKNKKIFNSHAIDTVITFKHPIMDDLTIKVCYAYNSAPGNDADILREDLFVKCGDAMSIAMYLANHYELSYVEVVNDQGEGIKISNR